jgi:acetoacetyl-[acyl-carrier protein] synthase
MSPAVTQVMMGKRHGKKALSAWQKANEPVAQAARSYEEETNRQPIRPVYHFDHDVRGGEDLAFTSNGMQLRGYGQPISLDLPNKYSDMC